MEALQVMIAEHDTHMRRKLVGYLGAHSDIVIHSAVGNGHDALKQLSAGVPDVLVTDIVLPGIDGFAILEMLMAKRATQGVKVIVLTALSRDSFIDRAMSLGAYYYMCKPCDLSLLCKRIAESTADEREKGKAFTSGEARIEQILSEDGILCGAKGVQYLRTAVLLGADMQVINGQITKKIYPEVARLYGTTTITVERSIRSAIKKGFHKDPQTAAQCPSNGEYIARLVQLVGGADKLALR